MIKQGNGAATRCPAAAVAAKDAFMTKENNTPRRLPGADLPEAGGRGARLALLLGGGILAASVGLGRSYAFYLFFLTVSAGLALLWLRAPRPLALVASVLAATPIAVAQQQFNCNVIFAAWLALLNPKGLFRLPRWIYPVTALALTGLVTSSFNWLDENLVGSLLRQGAFAFNFVLAPFVLLPLIYSRLEGSRDPGADLRGLLYALILPSTLLLAAARVFGRVTNAWEASLHSVSLPQGFLQYQLGRVAVNFLRTEVGFILAALICASAAVAVCRVGARLRLFAALCLTANLFLLLSTASFGSGLACLCGLAVILLGQLRSANPARVLGMAALLAALLCATYAVAPPAVKQYLAQRFEHRVTNADTDRLALWARGVDSFLENPAGVGWTLSVGERNRTYMHNDYLVYAVSYGATGGVAYALVFAGVLFSLFRAGSGSGGDPSSLAVHLAGLGVTVAAALNSITDHMTENRWYFTLIWSIIWYCYFCSRAAARAAEEEAAPAAAAVPLYRGRRALPAARHTPLGAPAACRPPAGGERGGA